MTRTDPLMEHLLNDFLKATSNEERETVAKAIRSAHAFACEARDTFAARTLKLLDVARAAASRLGPREANEIRDQACDAYIWSPTDNGGAT